MKMFGMTGAMNAVSGAGRSDQALMAALADSARTHRKSRPWFGVARHGITSRAVRPRPQSAEWIYRLETSDGYRVETSVVEVVASALASQLRRPAGTRPQSWVVTTPHGAISSATRSRDVFDLQGSTPESGRRGLDTIARQLGGGASRVSAPRRG